MASPLDPDALRAYRERNWAEVQERKERYWAADHRARGPVAGLQLGAALWEHARAVDPDWPSPEDRADDLAHHVALKQILDRLAHVFARAHGG